MPLRLMHRAKAKSEISLKLFGKTMRSKFLQPENARSLITSSWFLNTRAFMPSQQVKASLPILLTCSGITDMQTLLQSQNVHSPISCKLSGKTLSSNWWSILNALLPIYLTVFGIFTVWRFSQVLKARFSIISKLSGRMTCLMYLFISKAISPITFTSLSSWMLLKSTTESFPSHFTRRVPYCESSTVKWLFPFANESVGNQQRHSRNSTATEILLFIIIFYF